MEYVFFNGKYIYIAFSYNEIYRDFNETYNYDNKYFLINSYGCNKNNYCKYSSILSNYFGNGGDIVNERTKKVVYKYPYSKKEFLIKELKSNRFNSWVNGKLTGGKVMEKTFINDVNNFSTEHKGYLIKGDVFKVKDISSGWLNIIYTNKRGKTTIGWIPCKNTDICN
ncbi:hypothetical protein [Acinetobacter sp. WZC-1]|uniref:hypothetical protein n=1 Tax=Acinetobacter sp. WZC-1 TaxID=3459034 RepID=UPI00403DBC0D